MSGRLTTHVLDTTHGCPANGLEIKLFRLGEGAPSLLATVSTNDDGRCDAPLLQDDTFLQGEYELHFDVASYFTSKNMDIANIFLTVVPIRFSISEADAHYHVPLLVSPYGYSTYRGS